MYFAINMILDKHDGTSIPALTPQQVNTLIVIAYLHQIQQYPSITLTGLFELQKCHRALKLRMSYMHMNSTMKDNLQREPSL